MVSTGSRQDRAERIQWVRKTLSGTVAGLAVTGIVLGFIWPAFGSEELQEAQTICHRGSSVSNPYQQQAVTVSSIVAEKGHGSHTGPVYPTPGWGDIIPPFDYTDAGGEVAHYPGLNWTTDGIAVWQAACVVVLEPPIDPSPSPSPTVPPSPTGTSAPPTETSAPPTETSAPPPTETSAPPPTETSAPPPTEASASPTESSSVSSSPVPSPTLPPGASALPERPPVPAIAPALVRLAARVAIMPVLRAVAIGPGNHRVVLGELTVRERQKLVAELRARIQVPTGAPAGLGGSSRGDGVSGSDGWLAVGAFLALSGLAGIAFSRRRSF